MSGKRDRHGNQLYGKVHNAERKRWVKLVARGGVACWRCQKPIPAGSGWDLKHVDEDGRRLGYPYRPPEHMAATVRSRSGSFTVRRTGIRTRPTSRRPRTRPT